MKRRLLGLVVLLVVAALLADCGGNTEMVATTANCAGLPASEYWSCIEEEATNDHVAVGAPMSEDEEAEMNGTTPP